MKKFYILEKIDNQVMGIEVFKEGSLFHVSCPQKLSYKNWRGCRSIIVDNTEPIYFARETFTKGPKEILLFQINEKLQPLAIFSRTPYIVFKILDETITEVDLIYFAIDKKGTKNNLEFFLKNEVRVEAQYHFVCCIASLSLQLSSSAIMSLYLSDHVFWILITEGSDIVYIRKYTLDEFSTITESHIEEGVLTTIDYYHRFTNRPIDYFIAYGPRRDLAPSLAGLKHLDPLWDNLRGIDSEIILQWPEFYGALFVPSEFNLIPENHRLWLTNLRYARLIACVLLFFSFINYGAWYYFYNKNTTLTSTMNYKEHLLISKARQIQKKFPSKRLDQLKNYLDIVQNFYDQPRIDELLVWLSDIVPNKVEITKLIVKNISQNKSNKNSKKGALIDFYPHEIFIILNSQIKAPPEEARKAFYQIFQALSTKMILKNSRLVYDENQGIGLFSFELIPKKRV